MYGELPSQIGFASRGLEHSQQHGAERDASVTGYAAQVGLSIGHACDHFRSTVEGSALHPTLCSEGGRREQFATAFKRDHVVVLPGTQYISHGFIKQPTIGEFTSYTSAYSNKSKTQGASAGADCGLPKWDWPILRMRPEHMRLPHCSGRCGAVSVKRGNADMCIRAVYMSDEKKRA